MSRCAGEAESARNPVPSVDQLTPGGTAHHLVPRSGGGGAWVRTLASLPTISIFMLPSAVLIDVMPTTRKAPRYVDTVVPLAEVPLAALISYNHEAPPDGLHSLAPGIALATVSTLNCRMKSVTTRSFDFGRSIFQPILVNQSTVLLVPVPLTPLTVTDCVTRSARLRTSPQPLAVNGSLMA